MADIIKMDYAMMEEMASAFQASSDQLGESLTQVKNIAGLLEEGALLGVAGQAFSESCTGTLTSALTTIQAKMDEMKQDIETSMSAQRSTSSTVSGYYRD